MKIRKFSNKGAALVTVIMVMLVTMTFVGVVLSFITSQTKIEVYYEDNISTLHSVEAGLQKYLWDLNKESVAAIPLDTPIRYPEYNPVVEFELKKFDPECTENKMVIEATGSLLNDPSVTHTIKATYIKRSFTQYVYFSDNDPDNIWWLSGERCYGPYHTNTELLIKGCPEFFSNVTFVNRIKYYENKDYPGGSNNPIYHVTPQKVSKINYPSDNTELMNYALTDGYYYEGRTSIMLNANGTITVWNPSDVSNPGPVIRNLPSNGVIYVNGDGDPYNNRRFHEDTGNVFISGNLNGRLTVAAKNDIYITDYNPTYSNFNTAKNFTTNGICYADTDFDINTITGNITVTGSGKNDMLGLIADNNVSVLTKGWYNSNSVESARGEINVYGAVFAIKGSFVNSYNLQYGTAYGSFPDPDGDLIVRGAIIQKKRGVVGVGDEGYKKDYAHDPRMMYDYPPYFLMPEDSGWEISEWTEID